MSDYSDSDDPDYETYEERKEIIGSAIDDAESLLKEHMLNVWEIITSLSDANNNQINISEDTLIVLKAFENFCKEPTNPEYENYLKKDIVELVAATGETQWRLEEDIEEKFRNSLFWTSLIQYLKTRYVRELKETIGSAIDDTESVLRKNASNVWEFITNFSDADKLQINLFIHQLTHPLRYKVALIVLNGLNFFCTAPREERDIGDVVYYILDKLLKDDDILLNEVFMLSFKLLSSCVLSLGSSLFLR